VSHTALGLYGITPEVNGSSTSLAEVGTMLGAVASGIFLRRIRIGIAKIRSLMQFLQKIGVPLAGGFCPADKNVV
jgi:hypothetical protein